MFIVWQAQPPAYAIPLQVASKLIPIVISSNLVIQKVSLSVSIVQFLQDFAAIASSSWIPCRRSHRNWWVSSIFARRV